MWRSVLHACSTTTYKCHPIANHEPHKFIVICGAETHSDEQTPGICAFATLSGSGCSHLSGFHSSASSPQIFLFLFVPQMEMIKVVSFFNGTSVISVFPSAPRIGQARGMTTSEIVLSNKSQHQIRLQRIESRHTCGRLWIPEETHAQSHGRQRQDMEVP